MKTVCIVHPSEFSGKGGAEAVAMNVIESLQNHYEVTVLTVSKFNVNKLNQYFGTNVNKNIVIETPNYFGYNYINKIPGLNMGGIKNSLVKKFAKNKSSEYDILIGTKNEIILPGKSVQYIHFPSESFGYLDNISEYVGQKQIIKHRRTSRSTGAKIINSINEYISEYDRDRVSNSVLLANSKWTANLVEKIYDQRCEVVYPPIKGSESGNSSWESRENGFISIGSIHPSKNTLQSIRIIDKVRSRGHDVHLHIIGPIGNKTYYDRVKTESASREYVHLEGPIERDELLTMMKNHKYGIHCHPYEHFGMSIAEMVLAGQIPFVPDQGGQTEVVGNIDDVKYVGVIDAVNKIDGMLAESSRQYETVGNLPNAKEKFGAERFKEQIRDIVGNHGS